MRCRGCWQGHRAGRRGTATAVETPCAGRWVGAGPRGDGSGGGGGPTERNSRGKTHASPLRLQCMMGRIRG